MSLEQYLQELAHSEGPIVYADLMELSGLVDEELDEFRRWWPDIPDDKRRTLVERLITVAEDNAEVDFNSILRYCLEDEDHVVREHAVIGLWECDDRSLVAPLMALLKADPSEEVRAAAATALGKFGALAQAGKLLHRYGEQIKELLLEVLENDEASTDVRRRSLEAAAGFNTPRIIELISQAYDSADLRVRTSALYAMGKTCDSQWLSTLLEATDDVDPAIRYEAAVACGELGEEEAVPHLIALVQDEDLQVQLSSIHALGAIGGYLAKRALQRCARSEDELIQEEAQTALELLEVEDDPLGFKVQG
ncbi:MAG: HEAT repeat domain-containing protein [Chloroflexi bacterium]|nr:HEAT repeat domain-containing protein [Chloroflexota bacterium]